MSTINASNDVMMGWLVSARASGHHLRGPEAVEIPRGSELQRQLTLRYAYARAMLYRCECGAFVMYGWRSQDGAGITVHSNGSTVASPHIHSPCPIGRGGV